MATTLSECSTIPTSMHSTTTIISLSNYPPVSLKSTHRTYAPGKIVFCSIDLSPSPTSQAKYRAFGYLALLGDVRCDFLGGLTTSRDLNPMKVAPSTGEITASTPAGAGRS